ncbi:PEP-CTERM sorting domain-containing protein [Crocosphaera sp. UHCC 0190]|uniref:PEP-CTERM sorting domain-containing protein n=1 Tax=Crocosphaera sp. UHCC 0190 TaxID=3110246 RepID=UPI002B1F6FED|nr:PEP-CTERM sorting domain-containing protein [Crocosphaera sp. UHCC 0190]MEA5509734.1 PEP-CTERM sorting domain-containing protein [Crocosphaera sp. UHCC 0190]
MEHSLGFGITPDSKTTDFLSTSLRKKLASITVIGFSLGMLQGGMANALSFQGLGDFPGGDLLLSTPVHSIPTLPNDPFFSVSLGGSKDGLIAVGAGNSVNGYEAFRWTEEDGMIGLGSLIGTRGLELGRSYYSMARDTSQDGSVIVGRSNSVNGLEAFRWTQETGMVGLGDLPGGDFYSIAFGTSNDGSVVIGSSKSASGEEAFRWTQESGMVSLGDLPGGGFYSIAQGISADGSIIVGGGRSANGNEAFLWTQETGMVGLGDLPNGGFFSSAQGISGDGSVVIGQSRGDRGIEAFRWTQESGMVGLGDLPGGGVYSLARSASFDGSTIVGFGRTLNGNEAFIWDVTNGMRSVREVLVGFEINMTGWALIEARGISSDGTKIVGFGINPDGKAEAWLADLTPNQLPNNSILHNNFVSTVQTSEPSLSAVQTPEPTPNFAFLSVNIFGIASFFWRKRQKNLS